MCTRIGSTSAASVVRLDRTVDLERARPDLARLTRPLRAAAGYGDLEAARRVTHRRVRIDALRVPSAGVGATTVQPFSWRRARRGVSIPPTFGYCVVGRVDGVDRAAADLRSGRLCGLLPCSGCWLSVRRQRPRAGDWKGGHLAAFPAPPHRGPVPEGALTRARCAVPALEPRGCVRACAGILNVVDGCGRVTRWRGRGRRRDRTGRESRPPAVGVARRGGCLFGATSAGRDRRVRPGRRAGGRPRRCRRARRRRARRCRPRRRRAACTAPPRQG